MVKNEWKSLLGNKLMFLVIVAIIAIPVIYSGLFLKSMWDPYGNVDKLPVAVVNEDKAVDYQGKTLSIGDDLVAELKSNNSMDFDFVDSESAGNGLENGTYYMVITIPENFSDNATTLMDDVPKKMELRYATNPGSNYIASKLSESALVRIKEAVAAQVTQSYTQTVFDSIASAGDGMKQAADGATELKNGVQTAMGGNQTITDNLAKLSSSTLVFEDGVDTLTKGLAEYTAGVAALDEGVGSLKEGGTALVDGTDTLVNGAKELKDGADALAVGADALAAGVSSLSDNTDSLVQGVGAINAGADSLNKGADSAKQGAETLKAGTDNLVTGVTDVSNGLSQVKQIVDGHSDTGIPIAMMPSLSAAINKLYDGVGTPDSVSPTTLVGASKAVNMGTSTLNSGIANISMGAAALHAGTSELAAKTSELPAGVQKLKSGADSVSAGAGRLAAGTSAIVDGSTAVKNGMIQLDDGITAVQSGTHELKSNSAALNDGAAQLSEGSAQIHSGSVQLYEGSGQLGDGMVRLYEGTGTLETGLSDGVDKVNDNSLKNDTADMFASPVKDVETQITNVENNGHAMAPYMMSVGLWVGALAFCLMYPLATYKGELKSGAAWWLSKATILYPVALLQGICMIALLHYVAGFNPTHMMKTVLFACLTSVTFTAIMYFFNIVLGKVGSFIMLVFMVVQLAGSAGTYPVEISPSFVSKIHAFVPFTYTVDAFRSTISGGVSIAPSVCVMLILLIVFTIMTIIQFHIMAAKRKAGERVLYDWLEERGLA